MVNMEKEDLYNSSGMTHISQFFDKTGDKIEIRISDSTSATEEIQENINIKFSSFNFSQ